MEAIRIERLCKVYQARDGTDGEALRELSSGGEIHVRPTVEKIDLVVLVD